MAEGKEQECDMGLFPVKLNLFSREDSKGKQPVETCSGNAVMMGGGGRAKKGHTEFKSHQ